MFEPDLPPIRPIAPAPGGQARPDDVVGRDDDVVRAWDRLEVGSVRLNEPRRFGKTALLSLLETRAPDGWVVVRQSFQGVSTVEEVVCRLLVTIGHQQSLVRRIGRVVGEVLQGVEGEVALRVPGAAVHLTPSARSDPLRTLELVLVSVAERLGRGRGAARLALLWDEIPDMIVDVSGREGPRAAQSLLGTLRRLREEQTQIRWLMTGSVGFHHALRRVEGGDALVNDLAPLPLAPLEEDWATWLGECLLLGAQVSSEPGAARQLAKVTGGWPFLLHLVVAQMTRDRRGGLPAITGHGLDAFFDSVISDLDLSSQATSFLTRLPDYYGQQTAAAQGILDRLARGGSAAAEELTAELGKRGVRATEEELRDVLSWLCLDQYLVRGVGGGPVVPHYRWRHEPLRRIWCARREAM